MSSDIYKNISGGGVPWDMEDPPAALVNLVVQKAVQPCKTLEIGCGMGNAAIYLAKNGFDITGIDISEMALAEARIRAFKNQVECTFLCVDFLKDSIEITNTFDFIFDWSVLHHIFPDKRKEYAEKVYRLLKPGGIYLSVCFSENDDAFGGVGKFRKTPIGTTLYFSSEKEICELFGLHFRKIELEIIQIEGKPKTHLAVYALMKKEI